MDLSIARDPLDGGYCADYEAHGRQYNLGELQSFAWPGGYQITYGDNDGSLLCPACANAADSAACYCDHGRDQHSPVTGECFACPPNGYDANGMTFGYSCRAFTPSEKPITSWGLFEEGPDMQCDGCYRWILTDYGDPEDDGKHLAPIGAEQWTGRAITAEDVS